MTVMGIRCSNTDYTYCMLSGKQDEPTVVLTQRVVFPSGYSEPEALLWFYREMQTVFDAHSVDAVGIKKTETGARRSNPLESRIQNEAIVSLAAAEAGCFSVSRKVKSTIAKDLGLKGRAKYLQTKLDTSQISGFEDYSSKEQEAILTAWSCMS